ncbi:hypothetical protein [Demequina sp. NBRC 110057]|nr:hypothetical protein [Demequina sp. NBRC 110057]
MTADASTTTGEEQRRSLWRDRALRTHESTTTLRVGHVEALPEADMLA